MSSRFFSDKEISCKCGCGYKVEDSELLNLMDDLRVALGKPLKITSWCRCDAHNKKVGGEENSSHLRGLAVDISCETSFTRFTFLGLIRAKGIKRIGVYSGWIHIDIDKSLPQNVLWVGK